jgi:hypothetical protein
MTGNRRITVARVTAVRRADRISISSPGDFSIADVEEVDRPGTAAGPLLPYCADLVRHRSVYVGGVDTKAAQSAPFYYLYLRRNARAVVSVPWERGRLSGDSVREPVFLFSPGRCGSTLLSRILSGAGIPNVSEPDFYTQLTAKAVASALNPFRPAIQSAVANMGADLVAVAGEPLVVKLRAESCRAPALLLRTAEQRTIFMTRDFESWARSNGRAFRNGPRKSVGKYMQALSAYAWLKRNSKCHLVRYEDLLAHAPTTMGELGSFLHETISPAPVAATMKEDSQSGTPLEQGARGDLPGWEKRFADTMALWDSDKLKRARDSLGVDELFVR